MNLPNDYDTWRLDTPKHWDYDDEEKEEEINIDRPEFEHEE